MNTVLEKTNVESVKNAIQELIKAGTTFDVDTLERIYHDSLQVISIDLEDNVSIADKAAFKGLFETKRKAGSDPLSTWAKFDHVAVNENKAHVLISRKVNLVNEDQYLVLSIDLIWEDDRWQVTREVIFARPDESNS
ncbi:hypothetical protein Q4Q34_14740 [Flavivirga abyssicola]|uniref:hypothetical protein n=1 Tax=Flavivirga abyssicola TaxID=3063533 RepID=UPI0026E080F0|nr:hypothetical protein [Flavivirga sp. MEBiC07777]WVK12476.1 hypothetical protein Q4Q34_14740 [Flavivirga sp. MEBiC07777]